MGLLAETPKAKPRKGSAGHASTDEPVKNNNTNTRTMNTTITKNQLIAFAAEKLGPLDRIDNLDSARIWLQGRVNSAWAEYAAGNSSISQAKEAEEALCEVKERLSRAKYGITEEDQRSYYQELEMKQSLSGLS